MSGVVLNRFPDSWGNDSTTPAPITTGGGMIDPTWINAGASILGKAMSPTPNQSSASGYSSLDSSGWTIAFGGDAKGGSTFPWYVWAIGGLAAIVWFKSKK